MLLYQENEPRAGWTENLVSVVNGSLKSHHDQVSDRALWFTVDIWYHTNDTHIEYICIYIHYITLHYITLHCIALHCIALHCVALRCITLHCSTVQYSTLHYIKLHYITLTFIHTHTYLQAKYHRIMVMLYVVLPARLGGVKYSPRSFWWLVLSFSEQRQADLQLEVLHSQPCGEKHGGHGNICDGRTMNRCKTESKWIGWKEQLK